MKKSTTDQLVDNLEEKGFKPADKKAANAPKESFGRSVADWVEKYILPVIGVILVIGAVTYSSLHLLKQVHSMPKEAQGAITVVFSAFTLFYAYKAVRKEDKE